MKLRNMALLFALIAALGSTSVAQRTTAPSPVLRSPEIVLKEFYKWYIHAGIHNIDPFKGKARATLKKYVTARFIRRIDRDEKLVEGGREPGDVWDADYFLDTQDPTPGPDSDLKESDWLKSLSVSKVSVKGPTATAIVTFLDGYPTVKVTLITEGGVWKIDKVKDSR